MVKKEYLLDSNIIIKVWEEYPSLFGEIEKHESIDFKVYHSIVGELYKKEVVEYKGTSALTDRFIKLLDHIIGEDDLEFTLINKHHISMKYDSDKKIYYINGNKLSRNDFSLICICENYKYYTLVTEDKKIIKSAKAIVDPYRIMNLNEFFYDLEQFNVIYRKNSFET